MPDPLAWDHHLDEGSPLLVRKASAGGVVRISYPGRVLGWTDEQLVVGARWTHTGDFGDFRMTAGNPVIEYFSPDLWYSVIRLMDAHAQLLGWYCDLCFPPQLDPMKQPVALTYRDLALDVFVNPKKRLRVRDLEEFRRDILPRLDDRARRDCRRSLRHLRASIRSETGPFARKDGHLQRLEYLSPQLQ